MRATLLESGEGSAHTYSRLERWQALNRITSGVSFVLWVCFNSKLTHPLFSNTLSMLLQDAFEL